MTRVVAVHGIAQQRKGPNVLSTEWLPAIRDGMVLAGASPISEIDLAVAFYGDIFRPHGDRAIDPYFDADDLDDPDEQELLSLWWHEAAVTEPDVASPDIVGRARIPAGVQAALDALSSSQFFAGLAERALIFDLKQVRAYFGEPTVRAHARASVEACVTPETRVLIGHSLGSVVAWEAACAHPEWSLQGLVTLGSPLGIRNLIFDKLVPAPKEGLGAWPGSVKYWVNVSDRGDVVALVKDLRSRFGLRVENYRVDNGAAAHDARPYLTSREVGAAIARGL